MQQYLWLFFGVVWLGASWLISLLSGWRRLSEAYPERLPFTGKHWWFQSAEMGRKSHYGGSLIVGANHEGLHLSVLLPFRIAHPPLFIPWSDISMREQKARFSFTKVELAFQKAPGVPMRINTALARKIQQARGNPFAA
jgi:hypothetical protein